MSIKGRPTKTKGTVFDARIWVSGKVVNKTFPTEAEAERWVTLMKADQYRGIVNNPSAGRVRFDDYAERWKENRPKALAPRTVELYDDQLRRFINPTFGAVQIGKITKESVRVWRAKLSREVTTDMQAAKAYRLLHAILNTAVEDDLIGRNPCQVPEGGKEHSPERPFLPTAKVEEIMSLIAPRFRAMLVLAAVGGLRLGELLYLERRHIDFTPGGGTVTVENAAVELRSGEVVTTKTKSEAGKRTVALPDFVVDALRMHVDNFTGPEPTAILFTGVKGNRLRRGVFYKAWNKAKNLAGAKEFVPHDLRHTAGTTAAWMGATERELKEILGHSSSRAAKRYQHVADDRRRVVADRLAEAWATASSAEVLPISRDERAMEPAPAFPKAS